MAEKSNRLGDTCKKKRASDVGPRTDKMTGDWLSHSYPSGRCHSAMDKEGSSPLDVSRSYGGVTRQVFGTPSYPSPLDRIRTGKRERAAALGIGIARHDSFEGNQSFPKLARGKMKKVECTPDVKKIHGLKGNGMNDVSFAPGLSRGNFTPTQGLGDTSLGESWSFYNYMGGGATGVAFPTTVRNPNKAVVTINAKTSEILVANDMACELFGFSDDELIGLQLNDLVTLKSRSMVTISENHLEPTGEIVEVSGKVLDAIDSSGLVIPISLWIRKLDTDQPRCVVTMEPVERTTAKVTFDSTGTILDCDSKLAQLHGYTSACDVMGVKIKSLIPSFTMPQPGNKLTRELRKQKATGRTRSGTTFPLSIYIKCSETVSQSLMMDSSDSDLDTTTDVEVYMGVVWVFASISGMITLNPNGTIHNINNNFALMLFGFSQEELVGKDISFIIPSYDDERQKEEAIMQPTTANHVTPDIIKGSLLSEEAPAMDELFGDLSMSNSANTSLDVSLTAYMANHSLVDSATDSASDSKDKELQTAVRDQASTRGRKTDSPGVLCMDHGGDASKGMRLDPAKVLHNSGSPDSDEEEDLQDDQDTENEEEDERLLDQSVDSLDQESLTEGSGEEDLSQLSGDTDDLLEESSHALMTVLDPDATPKESPAESPRATPRAGHTRGMERLLQVKGGAPGVGPGPGLRPRPAPEGACTSTPKEGHGMSMTVSQDSGLGSVPGTTILEDDPSKVSGEDRVSDSSIRIRKLDARCDAGPPGRGSPLAHEGASVNCDAGGARVTATPPDGSGDAAAACRVSPQCLVHDDRRDAKRVSLTPTRRRRHHQHQQPHLDGRPVTSSPRAPVGDNMSRSARDTVPAEDSSRTNSTLNRSMPATLNGNSGGRNGSFSSSSKQPDDARRESTTSSGLQPQPQPPCHSCRQSHLGTPSPPLSQTPTALQKKALLHHDDDDDDADADLEMRRLEELTAGLHLDTTSTPNVHAARASRRPESLRKMIVANQRRESAALSRSSLGGSRAGSAGGSAGGSAPGSRASSTSGSLRRSGASRVGEGSYATRCRHRDGNMLGIIYQVRAIELEDGTLMHCLWVSRDPEDPGEGGRSCANLTLASSFNSTMGVSMDTSQLAEWSCVSLGEMLVQRADANSAEGHQSEKQLDSLRLSSAASQRESSCTPPSDGDAVPGDSSQTDHGESDYIGGCSDYDADYETLQCIGKGAYGFVKLARRIPDGEEVVVKFIKKSKVHSYGKSEDDTDCVPLELTLLSKLSHPNIIMMLDCFVTKDFYHLVMEKHGSGMDLFEFIDRSPNLDEPLVSYMFRQLVAAVRYLHSHGIVHRDIKDENVILDETFHMKLIDFGAAAYMEPGKLFGTFCGTIEYCSPEVLQGNKYEGPELEMWSLGVTLYTLVFGECPFYDVEETIQCVLKPPFDASSDLMDVISWLLQPRPEQRASVEDMEQDPWVVQPVDIRTYSWQEVLPNSEFTGNTASDHRGDSREEPRSRHHSASPSDDFRLDDLDLDIEDDLSHVGYTQIESDSDSLEPDFRLYKTV